MSSPFDTPLPVMVLAYNEEKRIAACLDSLFDGDPKLRLEVYVMANGCTDRTEELVRDYARKRPEVHLISIAVGDKCNAWNQFVHDVIPSRVPGRLAYAFVNGDARSVPGSLTALLEGLARHPHAHAAAAPPSSGRSMEHDRRKLIEERNVVANLYALRGDFVEALCAKSVRLPLGLEGDDGLLTALVKWSLDPRAAWDEERVIPCPDAGFLFDSVSALDPKEIRGYWRRLVRYGRRRYEFQLMGRRLRAGGIQALPVHVRELYREAGDLSLEWGGLYTLTNWVALRQIRKQAK